jgi:DNA invertase Pin-like site-specific DNA recombinase
MLEEEATNEKVERNKDGKMNISSKLQVKAALYARVSSEEQVEGYSIDAQIRAFRKLVEDRLWQGYHEYIDEGKSARTDNIDKRPAFKEMMEDALAGKFDVLVVHKLDRFSRNLRITLEYCDKLSKAGVDFLSMNEQMDFTTPSGKVHLAMVGAFAQYYSDNLSQETKKGWHERRTQGMYCGALPFGAMKGEDGIPIPDVQERKASIGSYKEENIKNYDGLMMAFALAVQSKSDREIAIALNSRGYRTTGTHGSKLFSKDTLRDMLKNKFYTGNIPDGQGGWIRAKHEPFISEEIWSQAQECRERNRRSPINHPAKATISSLAGITYCWYCKGRIHVGTSQNGKRRMFCHSRSKGWECQQKSALLDVYEYQVERYLETFSIPEDYQTKIMEAHKILQDAYADTEIQRTKLITKLERLKKLYGWGDLKEDQYLKERDGINKEIQMLTPPEEKSKVLDQLAAFLRDVSEAWKEADQNQRNRVARQLFQEIWVKDKQLIAVKPRPELDPFFQISYEQWLKKIESEDPIPLGVATSLSY